MKILKRGKIVVKTHRVSCRKCHSELEVSDTDGTYVSDRNEGYREVECPVCREPITIDITLFR